MFRQLIQRLLTAGTVNRFGLILGFISFWFMTPQFLGKQRLLRLRDLLSRGIRELPEIASAIVYGILFFVPVGGFVFLLWSNRLGFSPYSNWKHWLVGDILELLVRVLALPLAVIAEVLALEFVTKHIATPLLTKLADNSRLRKNSLILGAILCVCAFILQFTASFF